MRPAQRKRFVMSTPLGRFFTVNGNHVRRVIGEVRFIGGGHPLVYPWMPDGEVWIEDALPHDGPLFVAHECSEITDMVMKGWNYDRAHDRANAMEKAVQAVWPSRHAVERVIKRFHPRHYQPIVRAVLGWPRA